MLLPLPLIRRSCAGHLRGDGKQRQQDVCMLRRLILHVREYIPNTHIDWPCLFVTREIRKVSDIGGADYGHQCSSGREILLVESQESSANTCIRS